MLKVDRVNDCCSIVDRLTQRVYCRKRKREISGNLVNYGTDMDWDDSPIHSYFHSMVRQNAEAILFWKGGNYENNQGNLIFKRLYLILQRIVFRESVISGTSMTMKISFRDPSIEPSGKGLEAFFAYTGSLLTYIVIGIAIFAGHYDHVRDDELAVIISKVGL